MGPRRLCIRLKIAGEVRVVSWARESEGKHSFECEPRLGMHQCQR